MIAGQRSRVVNGGERVEGQFQISDSSSFLSGVIPAEAEIRIIFLKASFGP